MTISAIRQFLRHPDCIIFVGSGISQWSGLPSWSGLLRELADFLDEQGHGSELVRREIANGELLQAASYGFSKLTPASMGTIIKHAARLGTSKPHAIHKAIVRLGATSFITTNYDTLIEQALIQWRTDAFFRAAITNQHLVELADILGARSSHFVFKPHGDANDVSSIILTREQYRSLLPGGERHSALEALKTLLVTRPILYIGFGLRDPDFSYLRDLLINIYGGAIRDHWAIMPDVSVDEIDFWRNHYGIRLMGYTTYAGDDGSRDHRELLAMLEALNAGDSQPGTAAAVRPPDAPADHASEAARILALTRYAAGLSRRLAPSAKPIEVRISEMRDITVIQREWSQFEHWTTTRLLTEGPSSAYLIGSPGSGKSFALRLAAAQFASALYQACIDDRLAQSGLALPVLIELKLYQGDLRSLIDSELPAGLKLDQLRGKLRLKLFLDAFNEMTSEHLEEGALFRSLDALRDEIGDFDYAITSRTTDGLTDHSAKRSFFEIDRFDQLHVDAVLKDHGITLSGPFADEIMYLVSRPFFLQLVIRGAVDVPSNGSPRDIYASFVDKLQTGFSDRFSTGLQLAPICSKVAYRAIENKSEAFPLTWLHDQLASHVPVGAEFSAQDVINWLVGRDVIVPYSGRRASFVHQSITEYCAAMELARLSKLDAYSLRDMVASKKWDQCLFLGLALMEPKIAEELLDYIIRADLRLAIGAVRYAEEGQSAAVGKLLTAILKLVRRAGRERASSLWLRGLPIGPEHVPLLKQLLPIGGSIAGEAVELIAAAEGAAFKDELFNLLEEHCDDFNFSVNGIAPALMPLLGNDDLPRLMAIAVAHFCDAKEDYLVAIGDLLAKFEPSALLGAAMGPSGTISAEMVALLCESLSDRTDDASFHLLADFLLSHPDQAATSFYFFLLRDKAAASKGLFQHLTDQHVAALWRARDSAGLWDKGLRLVCLHRSDLKGVVNGMASDHSGIEAIALGYCAGHDNETLIVELEKLLGASDAELRSQPFNIFGIDELDWQRHEDLFMQIIVRDLPGLRKSLLTGSLHIRTMSRGSVGLEALRPVLDLVSVGFDDDSEGWWLLHQLGHVAAHLGNSEVQAFCLDAMVHGSERMKHWVKMHFLNWVEDITTDALSGNIVAALLSDLNIPNMITAHWYNPLGRLATERFVNEVLIPMARGASTAFVENLEVVLEAAGDRHGRRYLIPS